MHRTRFVLGVATALVAVLTLASTPKGMAPLPAQYLREGTFRSPDGWFQIHVPPNWEWFEMRNFDGDADPRWPDAINHTVGWLARDPKTLDDLAVMESYRPGGELITESFARSFENGASKAVQPDTMSDYSSELLTISGERSLHYRYKISRKNRPPIYRFGYITGMEHKLTLSTSDDKPVEPKRLWQIAVSIGWLKSP
jgi:hypothetical protein